MQGKIEDNTCFEPRVWLDVLATPSIKNYFKIGYIILNSTY